MPAIHTQAGRVSYTDTGAGPVLVLLHATLHDRRDYDPVLAALAQDHRALAFDWPGHGDSDPDAGGTEVTASALADVLEEIVLALDLRDLRLIGNSVGGFAAARLAIRHPDRVAGLVLVDNGGLGANNPVTRTFCRVMGTPAVARHVLPRFVSRYMQVKTDHDRAITDRAVARTRTPEGIALACSLWRSFASPGHDLRVHAEHLTAPTQIIWGRKDKAIPLSVARATHKILPQSHFAILDTGHVVFSSEPDAFLQIVKPFLASLPDAP